MKPNQPEFETFDDLAAAYVEHVQAGMADSTKEYARRYPQWSQEIHEIFPTILEMEELKAKKSSEHTDAHPFSDLTPERLGDFTVIREIGRGGMGIVYEVEQASLGRRVALKLLPKNFFTDADRRARFQREARTAGRLHYTNIVPIYGTGTVDGYDFYVMQLINGIPLDQFIDENRKKSRRSDYYRMVAAIGVQSARALHYAHQQGVLHRDIKPGNLILQRGDSSDEPMIWITDFGLAKHEEDEAGLTREESTLGTLRYMPIEQIEGYPTAKSDLYGLGLTLYELLTLQPAFQDKSPVKLVEKIQKSSPTIPRQVDSSIPRDLETIILKAIDRQASRRYPSADALADDLQRFLEDRPIVARRVGPIEKAWRWSRRNPLSAVLISLVALLVIGVVMTTTTGYYTAKAAERRETGLRISEAEGRQREAEQRQRAEEALELTIETLDELFTQVEANRTPGVKMDPAQAERTIKTIERMLLFYRQLAEQGKDSDQLQMKTAVALRRLGDTRRGVRQIDQAKLDLQQALSILNRLTTSAPGNIDYRIASARTQYTLGRTLKDQNDSQGSVEQIQQAIDQLESLPREIPQRKHVGELLRRFRQDLSPPPAFRGDPTIKKPASRAS